MATPSTTTLTDALRGMSRLLSAAVAGMILTVLTLGALIIGVFHPQLEDSTELTRLLREHQDGILDEEVGLRGWLATGDPVFLDVADDGRALAAATTNELTRTVGLDPRVDALLVEMLLVQERWTERWAAPMRAVDPTTLSDAARTELILEGKALVDEYRELHEDLIAQSTTRRDRMLELLEWTLLAGVLVAGLTGGVLFWLVQRASRRVRGAIVEPIHDLLTTMERIGSGDLAARPSRLGPEELQRLGDGLTAMAESLEHDRERLREQRRAARSVAQRLRETLEVAREIAGSLSTRYVAETVAAAASAMGEADRAVVWLVNLEDGRTLFPLYDTTLERGTLPDHSSVGLGDGEVGEAARDARPVHTGGTCCYPFVVGGRVIGVLQLDRASGVCAPEDAREALETLAIQAAASLQAARLHHQADELGQVDGLTGLLNRRRLEADLLVEFERANRYERPLAFVMADIDRFKPLNDTYGHQHGDAVLREVADVLTEEVRSSDTVYRYGGEEFAVVVREGSAQAAAELAERLRVAVARRTADDRSGGVTMSFGVACVPDAADTVEALVGAADRALYRAKREGRDRVVLAGVEVPVAGSD